MMCGVHVCLCDVRIEVSLRVRGAWLGASEDVDTTARFSAGRSGRCCAVAERSGGWAQCLAASMRLCTSSVRSVVGVDFAVVVEVL